MSDRPFAALDGSHRSLPRTATRLADVAPDAPIEVSVYLKRRPTPNAGSSGDARARMHAVRSEAHRDDIARIRTFAEQHGLTVSAVEPARRLVKLSGPAAKLEAAFRTKLAEYHDGTCQFRACSGPLYVPQDLQDTIESVLGLDTRPVARPRLVRPAPSATQAGHLPNEIGRLYQFPTGVTGAGQCIALIEFGGGFLPADTTMAFQAMGLKAPKVVAVPVDGARNQPSPDSGADSEVALDIQIAGGVAPGATIAVYFAPNSDQGFADAISAATHDTTHKPSVISISWGGPETEWTAQARQTMSSLLQDAAEVGVSVFTASGDSLATDGVDDGKAHVDFPSSSPWAIGCGGTAITVAGGKISAERVWNDGDSGTGGGISDAFPVPDFQKNAKLPPNANGGGSGRGVPDVSADAAPASGYVIVVHGQSGVAGGTSAVAPLWAGLAALINEKAAQPIGFFLPTLYTQPDLLRQVTTGNNRPTGSRIGYDAGPGWNACTGLGVPIGQALFQALTSGTPTS